MSKQWSYPEHSRPDLLEQLLTNRGLVDSNQIDVFLNPSYERDLHDPFLMKGMVEAVKRTIEALEKEEKIVIFGDYDADGVPGTAVLYEFFKKIGHRHLDIYIPDRHNEAYGLNSVAIEKLAEDGADLIITVDCGIANPVEVAQAKALGVDVIITDHHLAPAELPSAVAILDSKQEEDTYPYNMLCGAGVAFKLVQALIKVFQDPDAFSNGPGIVSEDLRERINDLLSPGWEKWLLDLVGIATISDMVPLDGENRALAYFGLKVLRQSRRLGLSALYKVAGINAAFLVEDDVGFSIAPRLNTASRMSHAKEAFELLTTTDPIEAETIARHLESKNKERRSSVDLIMSSIESAYQEGVNPPLIVVGAAEWSLGVLGLSAARVVEKYQCPVFVWGKNAAGEIKGSCRSDGSVNVVTLMEQAGGNNFFSNYGGHAMAGGFSLAAGRESQLYEALEVALGQLARTPVVDEYAVDASLSLDQVNETTWRIIEKLAPFGVGNPKPLFSFENILISTARGFGNGGIHLELGLASRWGIVKAIGFFTGADDYPDVTLEPGEKISLLAHVEKSYFKNRPELRLRIVDIKQAS